VFKGVPLKHRFGREILASPVQRFQGCIIPKLGLSSREYQKYLNKIEYDKKNLLLRQQCYMRHAASKINHLASMLFGSIVNPKLPPVERKFPSLDLVGPLLAPVRRSEGIYSTFYRSEIPKPTLEMAGKIVESQSDVVAAFEREVEKQEILTLILSVHPGKIRQLLRLCLICLISCVEIRSLR
jgi:hypothetical protein